MKVQNKWLTGIVICVTLLVLATFVEASGYKTCKKVYVCANLKCEWVVVCD